MFKFDYPKYNPRGLIFGRAYTWKEFSVSKVGSWTPRGLYTVGLIIGILRYFKKMWTLHIERSEHMWVNVCIWLIQRIVAGCDWRFDNLCGSCLQKQGWLPHRLSKRHSQPTTVLLRSTPPRTIKKLQLNKDWPVKRSIPQIERYDGYRKWSIKCPGRLFNFRTKRGGGAFNRYEAFIRRGRLFLI